MVPKRTVWDDGTAFKKESNKKEDQGGKWGQYQIRVATGRKAGAKSDAEARRESKRKIKDHLDGEQSRSRDYERSNQRRTGVEQDERKEERMLSVGLGKRGAGNRQEITGEPYIRKG